MTLQAHLLIDLEAPLKLPAIELAEWSRERPFVLRRRRHLLLRRCRRSEHRQRKGESENQARAGHDVLPHARAPGAGAGAPIGTPSCSTDSVIELGSGLVFSIRPSTGRMIRKY